MKKIFAIHDLKAGIFLQPFFMISTGEALRAFLDETANKDTTLGKHPEDFALYELGTFEESTGVFDTSIAPKNLGLASEFVARGQAD